MEEYTQLTLDDWLSMKESLKKDLIGVQESFVRIGYKLRRIEEDGLYERDGYKSIADFAKAEYGLSASTVSRFIAINKKYSIGGDSEELAPEFAQLGSSKLSEMLALPDSDLQMIKPEATRENIRELKAFNKSEPNPEEADDMHKLVKSFFQDNKELLKELFSTGMIEDPRKAADLINPSGNRVYRKGIYFVMFYDSEIKTKKFGGETESMAWAEFCQITQELFEGRWQQYAGENKAADNDGHRDCNDEHRDNDEAVQRSSEEPEGELSEDGKGEWNQEEADRDERGDGDHRRDSSEPEPEMGTADTNGEGTPEQSAPGTDMEPVRDGDAEESTPDRAADGDSDTEDEREELGGIGERTGKPDSERTERIPERYTEKPERTENETEESTQEREEREQKPEHESAAAVGEPDLEVELKKPEIVEKPFGTRLEFIGLLTEYGAAEYMQKEHEEGRLNGAMFLPAYRKDLVKWLEAQVNAAGGPWEEGV